MDSAVILNSIRRSRIPVHVRDLVRDLRDERRVEGENWARRADPMNLGMFHQGRQILLRSVGPAKFRPQVAEREILDALYRMVQTKTILLEHHGEVFDPAHRPIPMDAIVRLPNLNLQFKESNA